VILKGSQRGGARQMALHLMNGEQNEHVNVHQIRGFVAGSVLGALNESYALSKGTKCRQFMYSLSLNPPGSENVPVEVFEDALKRVEEKLGLDGQPRVVVFHEKEGRRHAHCVWSRIDVEAMKAINLPYTKRKLMEISKALFIEHGWTMPKGFIDPKAKSPLNYSRAEWQQAARTGRSPKAIKAALQDCWALSDSRKAFEHALKERGYYLTRGDRRGFVAVDVYGEVYSLSRQIGVKVKDLKQRLGDPKDLPSVSDTKEQLASQISALFQTYLEELDKSHKKALRPMLRTKRAMTRAHRADRAAQKAYQEKRWQDEENKRAARLRKGLKGVWDKLTGKYWQYRKGNEQEAWQAHIRDRDERQTLIERHLDQRQALQKQLDALRAEHEQERQDLLRDLSRMSDMTHDTPKPDYSPESLRGKFQDASRSSAIARNIHAAQGKDGPEAEPDLEPEV